jgi:Fe-S-cluster containining protein
MLFSLLSFLEAGDRSKVPRSCLQCGQCCASFGGHLRASAHDLRRWQEEGRQDLLDSTNRLGWIWVDPVTKEQVSPCPHLDRSDPEHARCAIYPLRPDMCRDYPTLAHGRRCLRGVFLGGASAAVVDIVAELLALVATIPLAA